GRPGAVLGGAGDWRAGRCRVAAAPQPARAARPSGRDGGNGGVARRPPVAGHRRRRGTPLAAGADARQRVARHRTPRVVLRHTPRVDRSACGIGTGVMKRSVLLVAVAIAMLALGASTVAAAPPQQLNLKVDGVGTVSAPLQVVLLLTLITFIPAVLVIMT